MHVHAHVMANEMRCVRPHTLPPLTPRHLSPYALAASPAHAAMLRGYLDEQAGEEE